MRPQHQQPLHRASRGAFTLTELLVVIAIIAILASLAAWGIMAMIKNRQRANTEATMRVLTKLLQTRWAAVIADAKKEPPSTEVLAFAGNNPEVAKVLWIKVRLVEAFPMRYEELKVETITPYATVVNRYIQPPSRRKPYFNKNQQLYESLKLKGGPKGESAACLLMALKSLQADGVSVDDQIKYAIADNDGGPGDITSNTINTLIDGFGTPLKFDRFFTGADNPYKDMANARNKRFGDTTDSDGRLLVPVPGWYSSLSRFDFEPPTGQFHVISADGTNANYVVPVICSMGPDRLAIGNGTDMTKPANLDNILSYKLGVE